MRMFQRFGVAEYWIVDPIAETIEIYKLAESAYDLVGAYSGGKTMYSAVLPDLALEPSSVFPPRLP
jgi:Uma2 family endonuclease